MVAAESSRPQMTTRPEKAEGRMPSSRFKKQAAPLEETSPVLLAIAKRLRNTRKRLRGIEELQAKLDAGKELNPDQVRR